MPTYDYVCSKCGHQFELFQSIKENPKRTCPKCKGRLKRLIGSGAGLLFKGSGFYLTDYRSEGYSKRAKEEAGAASGGDGKSSGTGGGSKEGAAKEGSATKESKSESAPKKENVPAKKSDKKGKSKAD
jgi:putative FmdB family regulatory protein